MTQPFSPNQLKAQYIVERWPYGWLICSPAPGQGVPFSALAELMPVLGKNAIIDSAITHHFIRYRSKHAVMCAGEEHNLKLWMQEIEQQISHLPPETQWWVGLEVGLSSAAIFSVLASDESQKAEAQEYSNGCTPRDADDFSRCQKLLQTFPDWKGQLNKVAEAFPESAWPKIIAEWDTIGAADDDVQSKLLRELNKV